MREAPTACAVRNISVRVCRCDATRARDPRCGALATRPAAGGARVALGRARGITFNTVYAERFLFLSPSAAGARCACLRSPGIVSRFLSPSHHTHFEPSVGAWHPINL